MLKEKSTPELLKELQEKFADTPGLIDAKKLQKDMYLFSILCKNMFGVKTFLNHQTLHFAITRKRIREKFFRKHQGASKWDSSDSILIFKKANSRRNYTRAVESGQSVSSSMM